MRRREFIAGLGGAAVCPVVARAQQRPAIPVIGFLSSSPGDSSQISAIFRNALKDAGYVEGQNLAIEFRYGTGLTNLTELARDLVSLKVAVIVVSGTSGTLFAAKAATSTIPIVYVGG